MGVKNQYHKNKLREQEFKEKIFESLKAAHQKGLLEGSRAILKVVGDKIAEKDKSPEERLEEVMRFVNASLKITDKTVEEANEKARVTKESFNSLGEDKPDEESEGSGEAPEKIDKPAEEESSEI